MGSGLAYLVDRCLSQIIPNQVTREDLHHTGIDSKTCLSRRWLQTAAPGSWGNIVCSRYTIIWKIGDFILCSLKHTRLDQSVTRTWNLRQREISLLNSKNRITNSLKDRGANLGGSSHYKYMKIALLTLCVLLNKMSRQWKRVRINFQYQIFFSPLINNWLYFLQPSRISEVRYVTFLLLCEKISVRKTPFM